MEQRRPHAFGGVSALGRRHLGAETQRKWSDLVVRRTAPALLGLFSLVTLLAHQRMTVRAEVARQAAWYRKPHPTFGALALVRREPWQHQAFRSSSCACEVVQLPRAVADRLAETLCQVA